jgi:hypothetical protein
VPLEDLVLHDAAMDLRAPTPALTRAHAVLRTRRRIAAAEPGWVIRPSGLAALSKCREEDDESVPARELTRPREPEEERAGEGDLDDDAFVAELAAIDALLERSTRVLAGAAPARAQDPLSLVYDLDWDEGARLQAWRRVVEDTRTLPPRESLFAMFDDTVLPYPRFSVLAGMQPGTAADPSTERVVFAPASP